MDIEKLENRIKEIEESMKRLLANFNVLEGAKTECLYWIEQLKKIEMPL